MSNLILPVPPGVSLKAKRTPILKSIVQGIDSGREARIKKLSAPRYRYEVDYEFLRTASPFLEWQRVVNFAVRHGGRYDSFLFQDPQDYQVTDHGFGVGDGATTSFQLQRSFGGANVSDLLGSWPVYTTPRTNRLRDSRAFDTANWLKARATVTANAALAPDGTVTMEKLVETTESGEHYVEQPDQGAVPMPNATVAVASVYAKAGERTWIKVAIVERDGTTVAFGFFDLTNGVTGSVSGGYTATIAALPGGQYRCSLSGSVGSGASAARARFILTTGNGVDAYVGDGTSGAYLWQGQLETGTTPTRPIATTSAAATEAPLYFPAIADGFEPVYEPVWSGTSILKDGVSQACPAAWSPGANGAVTFVAAPASGAVLSWTGNYYRRVRLNNDEPTFEQILPGFWRGSLELISVLP